MDTSNMDVRRYNAEAWDHYVAAGVEYTVPVSHEVVEEARKGNWQVILCSVKPVPREWFPNMNGIDVLCLACGGGQQAPIFAAAGAKVTVLDNSPAQLSQDEKVALRENLEIKTVAGDMRDLSAFADASFDLIFHPVSNCYVPEVQPVWDEAYRVLRYGGRLLAGFVQPVQYLFDFRAWQEGMLVVKNRLPYSDVEQLDKATLQELMHSKSALEFGHLLGDLIGGQTRAGFVISGYYDDDQPNDLLFGHIPVYGATCAHKIKWA